MLLSIDNNEWIKVNVIIICSHGWIMFNMRWIITTLMYFMIISTSGYYYPLNNELLDKITIIIIKSIRLYVNVYYMYDNINYI
jgi:hypothetical protein